MQVANQQRTSREHPGETLATHTSAEQNTETQNLKDSSTVLDLSTREQIIGEISYSDRSEAEHHDISSET